MDGYSLGKDIEQIKADLRDIKSSLGLLSTKDPRRKTERCGCKDKTKFSDARHMSTVVRERTISSTSSSVEVVRWLGNQASGTHRTPSGEEIILLSFVVKGNADECTPAIYDGLFDMASKAYSGGFTSPLGFQNHDNYYRQTGVFGFVNVSASPWYGMFCVIAGGGTDSNGRCCYSLLYITEDRNPNGSCKTHVNSAWARMTFAPHGIPFIINLDYADDDNRGLMWNFKEILPT